MLRYALRRLLWALPTLFGVSVVVFVLTTLLPAPTDRATLEATALATHDYAAFERGEDERKVRFLDLPRFLNLRPQDLRTTVHRLVARVAADEADAPLAAHELVRLGGGALSVLLPDLVKMDPEPRGRVAMALEPVARRMGIGSAADFESPSRAMLFWVHFWEDRSLDFTPPAVHRAVRRLAMRGGDAREAELRLIDTVALEELVAAMEPDEPAALARLTRVAAHASGRGTVVEEGAEAATLRRVVADWREWWYVHGTEYRVLTGAERVAAAVLETRYGRWAARIGRGQLGVSARDGEPIAPRLLSTARITLAETGLALLLSTTVAMAVGVFTAWRRGTTVDTVLALTLLGLHALPTFWSGEMLARVLTGRGVLAADRVEAPLTMRFALATLTLTLTAMATVSREQRSAMLEVLRQDYVRTARAKGVSLFSLLLVHALRNALARTVTLVTMQLPSLLGSAIVVESIFTLPGFGSETLRAVETHDVPWLMAAIMAAAAMTTLALVVSDLGLSLLDPRTRETLARRTPETP